MFPVLSEIVLHIAVCVLRWIQWEYDFRETGLEVINDRDPILSFGDGV